MAIIDSGVEADHPAVGGRLRASMRVELDGLRGRAGGRRRPGRRRCRRPRDGLRRDHPRVRARRRPGLDPGPRARQPRQGRGLCRGARMGDRRRRERRQPEPLVAQRGAVRDLPRPRGPRVLRERAPRQRREQRSRRELPVAVRRGRLGRRARRPRRVDLVLQPRAARRVRRPRRRCRCRVAGRRPDHRNREQLRGTAHRRARGADPRQAPGGVTVRGQGDPGGHVERRPSRGGRAPSAPSNREGRPRMVTPQDPRRA